uniref:hypothetical protein n=1 Tax=Ningiella ruwaisensis TaxID=2364274 RepID=UPI00109F65D7|nr:hypothetical protein [Ningiella ruwaisensis]
MKAIKEFKYYVDGNQTSTIKEGDVIPDVAVDYALKSGFCEKSKPEHDNKALATPQNKVKKPIKKQVKAKK